MQQLLVSMTMQGLLLAMAMLPTVTVKEQMRATQRVSYALSEGVTLCSKHAGTCARALSAPYTSTGALFAEPGQGLSESTMLEYSVGCCRHS